MWEGPSWLSSVTTAGDSPPTKWPRVTTPPNKRQSLISSDLDDSGLGVSFCSPPLSARAATRVSPLKTPSSTSGMSNSPYSRFRLSSFSSPTLSDRALRLSNCDNVIDVKFCEERLEKNHGRVDIARLGTSTAARSLEMPSTSKASPLDLPPPPTSSVFGAIETPSKCFPFLGDDSGCFGSNFSCLDDVSPLKRLVFDGDSRPSTSLDSGQAGDSGGFNVSPETVPPTKRGRADEDGAIFTSPKRPLKMFSRRWVRIVTGSTKAQRDMTVAAKEFLAQRGAMGTAMETPSFPRW